MRSEKLERAVVSGLEKCAPGVRRAGPQRWVFALSNGTPARFAARLQDEWLVLHAPLSGHTGDWWKLLCLNGRINGSPKFVLEGPGNAVSLRAEIPTDEEVDVSLRLIETCNAFQFALELFHSGPGTRSRNAEPSAKRQAKRSRPEPSAPEFDLAALGAGTNWPFNQREDGSAAFDLSDLSARDSFHQAVARQWPTGELSICVELTTCSKLSTAARLGLSLMLLRASGAVRGVRAAVETRERTAVLRCEAVFPSPPSPVELEHALAALAVACGLCGAETATLKEEAIAKTYLQLQLPAVETPESVIEPVGIGKISVVAA